MSPYSLVGFTQVLVSRRTVLKTVGCGIFCFVFWRTLAVGLSAYFWFCTRAQGLGVHTGCWGLDLVDGVQGKHPGLSACLPASRGALWLRWPCTDPCQFPSPSRAGEDAERCRVMEWKSLSPLRAPEYEIARLVHCFYLQTRIGAFYWRGGELDSLINPAGSFLSVAPDALSRSCWGGSGLSCFLGGEEI